jgi:hypothetical protein
MEGLGKINRLEALQNGLKMLRTITFAPVLTLTNNEIFFFKPFIFIHQPGLRLGEPLSN